MVEIKKIELTEEQQELVNEMKDEMCRKHGEYVLEIADKTVERLQYHGIRREVTQLAIPWIVSNLKLLDAAFQAARQRGISLLPTSIILGPNNDHLTPRVVEGYLECPIELKRGVEITDDEYSKMGFTIVEYLLSRYYSLSRIDGTYKIFMHSISFDLDIRDPNKPLTPHAMLRVEHYKV